MRRMTKKSLLCALTLSVVVLLAGSGVYTQQAGGPPESIAFASNRDGNNEIYVMNPDGSDQARLTFDSRNDHGQSPFPFVRIRTDLFKPHKLK